MDEELYIQQLNIRGGRMLTDLQHLQTGDSVELMVVEGLRGGWSDQVL